MYTSDYIMRMIEQFVQVLVRVLVHKELKEYPKALDELHLGALRILGVDWPVFVRLGDDGMIEMLKRRAGLDPRVFAIAADILKEEAEIMHLQGNDDEAWMRMVSAFSLYCETLKKMESEDVRMKAMRALRLIEDYELPPGVEEKRQWFMSAWTGGDGQGAV